MKTVLCIFLLRIYVIESRVFCQDNHASPWQPLGFSCPLNCGNIITAVKRLKIYDYKTMFMTNLRNYENRTTRESVTEIHAETLTNDIFSRPVRRNFNFVHGNSYKNNKIFKDKKFLTRLKVAMKMALSGNDVKCPPEVNSDNLKNISNCRRKYDHDDFIKKFTNLLNKYTHSEYQFTEEMTSMILEKILGTNMDLRHGLFNVKRILTYLSKAIQYHRTHIKPDVVIRLKSRHCLSISVAGCYCNNGFVENSGQCVQPSDCVQKHDSDYLARIILM
ncbi:uncharacterized protein LOC119189007 [Manduca sexta]|nr:uncharacterized protein LOC119189007 [Manduca sexta]